MKGESREKLDYVLKQIKNNAENEYSLSDSLIINDLLRFTFDLIRGDRAIFAVSNHTKVLTEYSYPESAVLKSDCLEYLLHKNVLHKERCENPGNNKAIMLSDFVNIHDLENDHFYRDIYNEYYLKNSILYQICVNLPSSYGMVSPLCIHRCKDGDFGQDFSEDDRECLNEINERMEDAVKTIELERTIHRYNTQNFNQQIIETDRLGKIINYTEKRIELLLEEYFDFTEKILTNKRTKVPPVMWNAFTKKKSYFSCTEKQSFRSKKNKHKELTVYSYNIQGQDRIYFLLQETISLSPQQKKIASYLKYNNKRKDIAMYMDISLNTVDTHIKNVHTIFGLRQECATEKQTDKLTKSLITLLSSGSIILG